MFWWYKCYFWCNKKTKYVKENEVATRNYAKKAYRDHGG
jgi:hypothetical protein